VSAEDNQTENNKWEVLRVPSPVDICSKLSSERCYLEAYWNGDMFEHNYQLEQFVENKLLENAAQKKITDFSRRIKLSYVNKSYV
jgi:hypothetical protein